MPLLASSPQQIRQDYFMWLCRYIHATDSGNSYYCLMKILYKIPFRWCIDLDENRAEDGLGVRNHFEHMHIYGNYEMTHKALNQVDCTVLEMLVGLAERMSDQIGCQPYIWFWELIENLNLQEMTDHDLNRFGGAERIHEVVDIFMDRKFQENGCGSLFPLDDPEEDQRNVEIWYQMQAYLLERYEV